jgi:Bacteriophage HK97-gp10, putative tail-component
MRKRKLRDLMIETHKRVDAALRKTTEETVEKLKQTSPVDTGLFRDSWSYEKTKNGYVIYNSAPYAEYLQDNPSPGWMDVITAEIPFRLDQNARKVN